MTTLEDQGAIELLKKPHHAVISTTNKDGSVHSTVVWADVEDGKPTVNSAVGRIWPTNLERDPRATLLVYNPDNPYEYLEVRGTADGTTDGADEHIDKLAKKYLDDEQRIKFVIRPDKVRYVTP
jgi:PPOX class probable F420-dependent enzyme